MLNTAESTRAKLPLKGSFTYHKMIRHACLRFSHPENLPTAAGIELPTLDLQDGHATSKPPSRLRYQYSDTFLIARCQSSTISRLIVSRLIATHRLFRKCCVSQNQCQKYGTTHCPFRKCCISQNQCWNMAPLILHSVNAASVRTNFGSMAPLIVYSVNAASVRTNVGIWRH
ncbi:hypothetical protein TNCV_3315291 [Trichonephila clavipes]|nr:hypothetical protein TNCV_3315291 [Trichonephila clavipes]